MGSQSRRTDSNPWERLRTIWERPAVTAGLLAVFSVGFFAVGWRLATESVPDHDEVLTLRLARLESVGALLEVLRTGPDATPPGYHLMVRAATRGAGEESRSLGAWARVPSLAGYWVACMAVFGLTASRCGVGPAWAAMMGLLITGAYGWAWTARVYAVLLGWSALLLACWAIAAGARSVAIRWAAIAGAGISLTAGLTCHYFLALMLIPIGMGEVTRLMRGRRDYALWVALLLPFLVLIPLRPYFQHAREWESYVQAFYGTPSWSQLAGFFLDAGGGRLVTPMTIIVVITAMLTTSRDRERDPDRAPIAPIIVGLLLMPVFLIAVGKLGRAGYADRYVLEGALGIVLALGWGLARVDHRRGRLRDESTQDTTPQDTTPQDTTPQDTPPLWWSEATAAVFFGVFLFQVYVEDAKLSARAGALERGWVTAMSLTQARESDRTANDLQIEDGLPIVVTMNNWYVEARELAPTAWSERLVYIPRYPAFDNLDPEDPAVADKFIQSIYQAMPGFRVVTRQNWPSNRDFYLIGRPGDPWLQELANQGFQLDYLGSWDSRYGTILALKARAATP